MNNNLSRLPSLERCVESIEAAYARLGHSLGWRFVTGPRRTFAVGTRIAFITLNPAGRAEDPAHPRANSEDGSAYWIESWEGCPAGAAPLQRQVQELFARIALIAGASESAREFVESRVLTAHFVPFRSPQLKALPRHQESVAFARTLWSDILVAWTPRTILTIDRETFEGLHAILSAPPGARVIDQQVFPTGWGSYVAEACLFRTPDREEAVTLARLPHLSRFKLFSREKYRQPVQAFLDYVFTPGSSPSAAAAPLPPARGGFSIPAEARSAKERRRRDPVTPANRIAPPEGPLRLFGIEGADLYPEWEEHIQDQEGRFAFRLLVQIAISSRQLVLSFKRKGSLKTCCLHYRSEQRRRQPYSFIVNKRELKFYFRLSEVRSGRERLREDFDSFDDSNSKGEWTVKLKTVEDVRRLTAHADLLV